MAKTKIHPAEGFGAHIRDVDALSDQVAALEAAGQNIVEDTTPQLGGELDTNDNAIYAKPMAAPAHKEGLVFYDSTENALSYYNEIADMTVNLGQESILPYKNSTGVLIPNGTPVYISGASGGYAEITPALADHATPRVVGMTTHDIADGTVGYVTSFGKVRDINTSGFSAGDTIYLSDVAAGDITNTAPSSPVDTIILGVVSEAAVNGSIVVQIRTLDAVVISRAFIGSVVESLAFTCTSNGTVVTANISGGAGEDHVHLLFSTGTYAWDVSPAKTVALTPGSDTSPQINYIYVPVATKVLTVSTTGFPVTEHIPIATVVCQSAAGVQTDGAYKTHVWTDHLSTAGDNGHIGHLNAWVRAQHATWTSGVALTTNITTNAGTLDDVEISTTAGVILQLHTHDFGVQTAPAPFYVVNDSIVPYRKSTNLNEFLLDSAGVSLSASRFNVVLWGSVNEDTADCKIFVNLPDGSYGNDNDAILDVEKTANYIIPDDFKGTGFLIARLTLRHQTQNNGTWTLLNTEDLRGSLPGARVAGSGSVASENFDDVGFTLFDADDSTRIAKFDAGSITTGNTRTMTIPDADTDILAADMVSTPPSEGDQLVYSSGLWVPSAAALMTQVSAETTVARVPSFAVPLAADVWYEIYINCLFVGAGHVWIQTSKDAGATGEVLAVMGANIRRIAGSASTETIETRDIQGSVGLPAAGIAGDGGLFVLRGGRRANGAISFEVWGNILDSGTAEMGTFRGYFNAEDNAGVNGLYISGSTQFETGATLKVFSYNI